MIKTREEVPVEDRWNVEALYPNQEEWEKAFQSFASQAQQPLKWPALQAFQGTLHESPEKVKLALELMMSIDRELSKLYTYAHLRHDEDIANPVFKKSYEQILALAHAFAQETAWFQPEILKLPDETLESYLASPYLTAYRFYLERIIRVKKHTLSPENEKLLALAGQALQTSYKTFSSLNDADFKFGSVLNSEGEEKPLSHATYSLYIRDQDRQLRKNAFENYHKHYSDFENTLCELLTGQVQNHIFQARARHYSSCLEAALFPKNINTAVYHALIQAVNEQISVLHRYMQLRKRILKLDELHLYDVYVPLTSAIDIRLPYQEAEDLVIESVVPLGEEYQSFLRQGLKDHRWVDRYENRNKRSGAYSSGCYDSMPYILMNYKDLLRDVFTLAHEAGHSMHSLYSRRSQPYHYSDYPIFLAEVASTFNEDLLIRLLMQKCTDPIEKIFLLNQKIEDIRGTLFRQTMFAEFELFVHQQSEENVPLTPQFLKQAYRELNRKYFGPSVVIDQEIDIEWARIPHFYYNFYVFQYATGISAALALSEKVVSGKEEDRDAYLNFLKGGSSQYPIDMLKKAGIDMESPEPVKSAIRKFDELLGELEQLLDQVDPISAKK
ncbi:oligoendopeptidase F [Candidatus Protochlamydia phocaeensis]|uniref:oligoendopeptidase F n=1 Tax=Candidatus Protochlamydia phocaeensis TaxID=1414722 RepID=UPI0008397744|nr:oligoendopeptidase F [Candidatus Protochlamydia phocaeensis]